MEQNDSLKQAAFLTLIEMVGDYGAKVDQPVLTYGGYNALAFTLTRALKNNNLILVNSYWDAISNIMTTTLGWALGERPSKEQWIGIALISVGLFFLRKD